MSELTITKKVESICNIAIDNAKTFGKNLDFSEKSIIDIEEILDYFWNDMHKGLEEKPTESEIFSVATVWGAYVGEVMRRKIGDKCIWINETVSDFGEVLHIKVGSKRTFPIKKGI